MDVMFFLNDRLIFIRHLYKTAGEPFRETIRKIDCNEAPFEPSYSEDGEPANMLEWRTATVAIEMLGRTCVSMLSESLKLYFKAWEVELGLSSKDTHEKAFKRGFVHGYRASFGDALNVDWGECPANFDILEQIVLARNADQHSGNITTTRAIHPKSDQEKHSQLFFVDERERELIRDSDTTSRWWMDPSVVVSGAKLETAIQHVEMMAAWFEAQIAKKQQSGRIVQTVNFNEQLLSLQGKVKAAQDEAVMASMFHEAWKPAAYDDGLHERLGTSYATHTFISIRTALRREMLLALMRLWDTDRKNRAIGMEFIAKTLRDDQFFSALVLERTRRVGMSSPHVEVLMRETLESKLQKVTELIGKYTKGGVHHSVLEKLRILRHEHLAHHQTTPTKATGADANDKEIEAFFDDNMEIVTLLLTLVQGTAFDISTEVAGVYRNYARYFWVGVRSERTEGHPNYRAPT